MRRIHFVHICTTVILLITTSRWEPSFLIKYKGFSIVGWDFLSLATFYSQDVLELRHFTVESSGAWDGLRFWMFWRWDIL